LRKPDIWLGADDGIHRAAQFSWRLLLFLPAAVAAAMLMLWLERSEESRSPAISSTPVTAAQSRLRASHRNPATSEGAQDDTTIVSDYASALGATSAEDE
jgi:outer membrane biosynthesis protein TonB